MKKCLVVDDYPGYRTAQTRTMKALGFAVTSAENGEAALHACWKELPEVILLDLDMPVMDGFDFLIELRKLPDGKNPKVIVCSSRDDISIIARVIRIGANDFLSKPFEQEKLIEKLQKLGLMQAEKDKKPDS